MDGDWRKIGWAYAKGSVWPLVLTLGLFLFFRDFLGLKESEATTDTIVVATAVMVALYQPQLERYADRWIATVKSWLTQIRSKNSPS